MLPLDQWSLYSVATFSLSGPSTVLPPPRLAVYGRGVAVVLPRCVSSRIVCGVCAVRHTDRQTDGQVVGECE